MFQKDIARPRIEVALWSYSDDLHACERWMRSLSADELQRAAAYRFERDRNMFIAGRYLLKRLLSAQVGMKPEDLRLLPGAFGKLHVRPPVDLQFSLANADGLVAAAMAVGAGCASVGIDCERTDNEIEDAALHSYCTVDERRWLDQMPPDDRWRAAMTLWTLKESHLKALGTGLSEDPRNVVVTWNGNAWPIVVHDGSEDPDWHHYIIDSDSQHVVALAVRSLSGPPDIAVRRFQDDSALSK